MADEVTRLEVELPVKLVAEMQALVDAGWFRDRDQILAEALRRCLESHRPQLVERFAHEDLEWGLHGSE
jgi:Arc/MetJ-type ribon-helix-helix transcriptional regulator